MWHNPTPWNVRRGTFSAVQQNDDLYQDEPFLALKEDDAQASQIIQRSRRSTIYSPWIWTTVNLLILGGTVLLNTMDYVPFLQSSAGTSRCLQRSPDTLSDAIRATSNYSPVLRDLDLEINDVHMNGSLWPDKNPSWMRAEPGPETDELWQRYEPHDVFPITAEDIRAIGGDPSIAVKFPEEFGHGDDAYMASLDMLHKSHCLNELRKMTFEDYKEKAPVKTKRHGRLWWVHLRHCVDMLMQDQMCHADADIIYYHWVDVQDIPWPEFGLRRKCRNWDQIHNWARDRYVDYDLIVNWTKPSSGITELPFERGYYEAYGFEDSSMFPNGEGYKW